MMKARDPSDVAELCCRARIDADGGRAFVKRDFQRWTAKRKAELTIEILSGKLTVAQACKRFKLDASTVQLWVDAFVETGERGLKTSRLKIRTEGGRPPTPLPTKLPYASSRVRAPHSRSMLVPGLCRTTKSTKLGDLCKIPGRTLNGPNELMVKPLPLVLHGYHM